MLYYGGIGCDSQGGLQGRLTLPGPLKTLRDCLSCGSQFRPGNWKQVRCVTCGRRVQLEYQRQYSRRYYEAHQEAIREYGRRWQAARRAGVPPRRKGHPRVPPVDPRICLRCGADYMPLSGNQKFCSPCGPLAFREMARISTKVYRQLHPERVKESIERLREKNGERYRAAKRRWTSRDSDRTRVTVLGHYSKGTLACVCCGESQFDFLTLDHINNDGGQERKRLSNSKKGGVNYYRWLLKNGLPPGLQTLCFNCNGSKGKHGVCIHKANAISPIP
jgi:DNA-directed RNA polymerase subunit N (RpoN/RPB10)